MPFTNRVQLFVENLDEEAREEFLQQVLMRQNGVQEVQTSMLQHSATVAGRMLDLEAIRSSLEGAGFALVSMTRSD